MISVSLKFVVVALSSYYIVRWLSQNADRLRLLDHANHRSSHSEKMPQGGGLGFVAISSLFGIYLAVTESSSLWLLIGLGLVLAVIGLIDDIRDVSAKIRLAVQVMVCVVFLAFVGDIPAMTIMNVLTIDGWILLGLLLLAGVWWINLFNFMDGIDGLAGVQAVTMLSVAAGLILWTSPDVIGEPLWSLMLCIVAAVLGFLLLNWAPAKIFMGDVGSTWLAFMIFALALLSIQSGLLSYAAWFTLSAVFLTDATVTLLTRIARNERWYEAHRSHVYQRLSRHWQGDRKAGHRTVSLLVLSINLVWLAPLAWAVIVWPEYTAAWLFTAYLPIVVGVLWLGAGGGR